jgi:hypothetical protein
MKFPRVAAAIFVLLLIGGLAVAVIEGVAIVGPTLAHGSNVEHTDGIVIKVNPDRTILFKTVSGQELQFVCSERCLREIAHIQRHVREKAHTDVYYIEQPNHVLDAIDID